VVAAALPQSRGFLRSEDKHTFVFPSRSVWEEEEEEEEVGE